MDVTLGGGTDAGVFAVSGVSEPSRSFDLVGFRCARQPSLVRANA